MRNGEEKLHRSEIFIATESKSPMSSVGAAYPVFAPLGSLNLMSLLRSWSRFLCAVAIKISVPLSFSSPLDRHDRYRNPAFSSSRTYRTLSSFIVSDAHF